MAGSDASVDAVRGAGIRPVEHVLIEPLARDADDLAPFEAVLRQHADGRRTLSGAGEQWLPDLPAGWRVLVVSGAERDAADAPTARVVDGIPDATGAVEVVFDGSRVRRPARIDERVAVDGVRVGVRVGATDLGGQLRDVSVRGARLSHEGEPLPIGTEVTLVGALDAMDGGRRDWELRYEVSWAGLGGEAGDQAVAGLRCLDGQRLASARLTRWALRAARA